MIGEITLSTSFGSSVDYLVSLKTEDQKLTNAELALKYPSKAGTPDGPRWYEGERHRIIGGVMSGETKQELKSELAAIRRIRPDIKTPCMCISVRAAHEDTVSPGVWREVVAPEIIASLGMEKCPYFVVQHRDKDDHIHILISRIQLDGKVVSDSQSYRKVEEVLRDIEGRFNFRRVSSSLESNERAMSWLEHKQAKTGGGSSSSSNVRVELQQCISKVLTDNPTFTQFINTLSKEHDVSISLRLEEDGRPRGIAFSCHGVTISGSSLGHGYSWRKLIERGLVFEESDLLRVQQVSASTGSSGDDNARLLNTSSLLAEISAPQQQRHPFTLTLR